MYILLSDDKYQMVQDSSKKCTGQCRHNSNPVATLPHAAVVFHMQPFNFVSTPWKIIVPIANHHPTHHHPQSLHTPPTPPPTSIPPNPAPTIKTTTNFTTHPHHPPHYHPLHNPTPPPPPQTPNPPHHPPTPPPHTPSPSPTHPTNPTNTHPKNPLTTHPWIKSWALMPGSPCSNPSVLPLALPGL